MIHIATLTKVRIGERRFIGKNAAFDVILGIILGSVASRAINASASFLVTMFFLVSIHRLFACIAFRSDWFGTLIKGSKSKWGEGASLRGR